MKEYFGLIRDESKPIEERLFALLTTIALSALLAMFVVGIVIGESLADVFVLGGCLAVFIIMLAIAVRFHIIHILAPISAFMIILILLPVTFFAGGGIYGGSPLWFVFCTLYVSMVISGKIKYVLIALDVLVGAACYLVAYFKPETVMAHTAQEAYIDSYVSVVFVCAMLGVMVAFEISVLKKSMEKYREKSHEVEGLNESQNRFFSSMSHEIRTPINTIIGLNEMILREDISEEVAEDARNIQSSSKVLLSVINDILDMSKIASGRMEIVPVSYDVTALLTEIYNMMAGRVKEKGLALYMDVDPNMPAQLFGDEVRVKQILINLCGNAIKYTEEGSITISVHSTLADSTHVRVTFSVEDTGIGIRKENLPYLFDAFRRVDEKQNRNIEGTGLGLSIVKQLVELMNGEVTVSSVYTKGSTFTVTIEQEMVSEATIGRFDPSVKMRRDRSAGFRQIFEAPQACVLIVDDNEANLLVERKLLRHTLMKVETANSGQEALSACLEKRYDVILMDHLMPGMDGIECLKAIRDQVGGLNRETPVIVLTANAGSENQSLYKRSGFDDYVLKPVDPEILEEALIGVLPADKLRIEKSEAVHDDKTDEMQRQVRRKIPLMITTDSVADLPKQLVENMKIPVLPYQVYTGDGIFSDGIEAGGDVIIRSMMYKKVVAKSQAPTVEEYEEFFAHQLSLAQHVIHIAMAKRSSKGYEHACEAALSFYNVRVVNSAHLSSGMGLVVLAAKEYTASGVTDVEKIVSFIKQKREKIRTSFVVDSTEYLTRAGRLSQRVHKICNGLMIHPIISLENSAMQVRRVIFGNREDAWAKYIKKTFMDADRVDTNVLFITYAGMKMSELEEVKRQVLAIVPFEKIYLQKASPAISINCGPGTFGLIYSEK